MSKLLSGPAIAVAAIGVFAVSLPFTAHADDNGNGGGHTPVVVCHNGQALTIDDDALDAHLSHGDLYPVPVEGCFASAPDPEPEPDPDPVDPPVEEPNPQPDPETPPVVDPPVDPPVVDPDPDPVDPDPQPDPDPQTPPAGSEDPAPSDPTAPDKPGKPAPNPDASAPDTGDKGGAPDKGAPDKAGAPTAPLSPSDRDLAEHLDVAPAVIANLPRADRNWAKAQRADGMKQKVLAGKIKRMSKRAKAGLVTRLPNTGAAENGVLISSALGLMTGGVMLMLRGRRRPVRTQA